MLQCGPHRVTPNPTPTPNHRASAITVRPDHAHVAKVRLFCLPYAGGGASMFHAWARDFRSDVQICPIQLPGRENRLRERPHTRISAVVGELAGAIAPHLDKPYAIFGHSMGGAIAFELARELRRRGTLQPVHLLISAARAPHRPSPFAPLAHLPDVTFWEAVQERYGRFDDDVARVRELRDLLLPILRADLELIETYRCTDESPFECPITVFHGADDATVSHHDLTEWGRHTRGQFDTCALPGGHFFLKLLESRDLLLGEIERRLLGGNRQQS